MPSLSNVHFPTLAGNAVNTWRFQGQIILKGLKKAGELPWRETHCLDDVFK
jgi:hypothetical protein